MGVEFGLDAAVVFLYYSFYHLENAQLRVGSFSIVKNPLAL